MKRFITFFLLLSISTFKLDAQDINIMLAGLKSDSQKADTLFAMGRMQFRKARFDSADFFLKKGFSFAERSGNDELIARYIIEQCYIHLFGEKFKTGLNELKKIRPHLAKTSSHELHMRYLLLTGRFYENLHHNDSALHYYHECETLNNSNNPYDNWRVYYNMAQMFKRSEAFSESEKYFIKAYGITKPKGIKADHITVLIEFADLYYLLEKPEKFAPLMYEQEKMMEQVKINLSKNPSHSMFFNARKKEPLEKKVLFMENVKQQLNKGAHIVRAAQANNYIAEFYEEANQPANALKYIEENKQLFEKGHDIVNLYNNTRIAYRLMKKAGMANEAVLEADRLIMLKDSIIVLQQREMVLDIEAKYQADKKEKEILFLNSENLLHQKEIALLNTREKLNAFTLMRETELKNGLLIENKLKDSIVKSEMANNELIISENKLKSRQLANEQLLKAVVNRENILKGKELFREKRIRWQLTLGASLLLLSGLTIFLMYNKQRAKNRIILKQADDLQTLMKEIHHRVKNNLQVISSLLDLQSLSIKDKQAAGAVREGKIRVQSMALIHQNLYSDGNIKGILMEDYIKNLVENLFNSYNIQKDKIRLVTDIDHLNLDVDTVIPLGLIINELISNALKYAFKETPKGEIYVALNESNKQLRLQIKDNGCGFPPNWHKIQSNSFGYNLINAFAQKLKAKLDIYNDGGACVSLNISRYKLA
jgi:two-component sensor histidine kinase